MKPITIEWTDADLNDHQFVMNVDEHKDIDSIVQKEVFNQAVVRYHWNGASGISKELSEGIVEVLNAKDVKYRVIQDNGIILQFELVNYYSAYAIFTVDLWNMKFLMDFEGKAYSELDHQKANKICSILEDAKFKRAVDVEDFTTNERRE